MMHVFKSHVKINPLEDETTPYITPVATSESSPFHPITMSDPIRPTYLRDGAKGTHNK